MSQGLRVAAGGTACMAGEPVTVWRPQVEADYEKGAEDVDLRSQAYIKKAADRMPNIGRKVRMRSGS